MGMFFGDVRWGCFFGLEFCLGIFHGDSMGMQWGCKGVCVSIYIYTYIYIYINTASKTCFDCYTGVLIGFNTPLRNSSINNLALTNRQWNLELSENGRFAINLWQLDVANNDQWSTSGWNGALKRISWRLGCGSQVEIASGFGVGESDASSTLVFQYVWKIGCFWLIVDDFLILKKPAGVWKWLAYTSIFWPSNDSEEDD